MKRASAIVILAGIVVTSGIMIGSVIGRTFFGLSHDHMLMLGGTAFAAMLGIFMLANRLTDGVWIKRENPERKAVFDAGLKRMWLGYALGSLAVVPGVIVMIRLGVEFKHRDDAVGRRRHRRRRCPACAPHGPSPEGFALIGLKQTAPHPMTHRQLAFRATARCPVSS